MHPLTFLEWIYLKHLLKKHIQYSIECQCFSVYNKTPSVNYRVNQLVAHACDPISCEAEDCHNLEVSLVYWEFQARASKETVVV